MAQVAGQLRTGHAPDRKDALIPQIVNRECRRDLSEDTAGAARVLQKGGYERGLVFVTVDHIDFGTFTCQERQRGLLKEDPPLRLIRILGQGRGVHVDAATLKVPAILDHEYPHVGIRKRSAVNRCERRLVSEIDPEWFRIQCRPAFPAPILEGDDHVDCQAPNSQAPLAKSR